MENVFALLRLSAGITACVPMGRVELLHLLSMHAEYTAPPDCCNSIRIVLVSEFSICKLSMLSISKSVIQRPSKILLPLNSGELKKWRNWNFCLPLTSDQILIVHIYLKVGRISTVKSLQMNLFIF